MQTVQADLLGMVLGEYRVERLLGSGKLTAVYMGSHVTQEQQVMITTFLLPAEFSSQAREQFRARFLRESVILTHLQHQHILPFYAANEQFGYPYLVTPFVKENSLASVMNTHPRFKAEQVLVLVKQIADALDYAHSQGIFHGALIPSSILLSEKQGVHIAGFGFTRLLAMQGIEQSNRSYAHLYNIVGTLLCSLAYMAPEWLRGAAIDARTDVYALGVLLFQLLTGTLPFPQMQSVEMALQAIGQPIPSVNTLCSDVPVGLDFIVQQALESNPKQRFQSAGNLARAFERAMLVIQAATAVPQVNVLHAKQDTQVTLPPTVNWFDEEALAEMANDAKPTTSLTGRQRTVSGMLKGQDNNWQLKPPIVTSQMPALKATQGNRVEEQATGGIPVLEGDAVPSADPFVWWSTVSLGQGEGQAPGTFQARTTTLRPTSALRKRPQPTRAERRRALTILAGSGVAAVGILGFGGIGLAHFIEGHLHQQTTTALSPSTTATTMPTAQPSPTTQAAPTKGPTPKPTTQPSPTAQPTAQSTTQPTTQPTAQPTSQPTQPPTPTPTPTQQPPTPTPTPSHSGTVIGSTSMGTNSSQNFTDPHNGGGGILIHLQNGNFVAYYRACTHAGVPVYYNTGNQKLVCPAHGAVFDPANNGQVLGGPAPSPLPGIQITVNSDGTITV